MIRVHLFENFEVDKKAKETHRRTYCFKFCSKERVIDAKRDLVDTTSHGGVVVLIKYYTLILKRKCETL